MKSLTSVSLYSGAGGLDYGFESAGFETRVAVDNDRDACTTLNTSRDWPVICSDIHDLSPEDLLQVSGLKRGEPDILIGGPPCQPFSKSGYWANGDARRLADPRARTLDAFMRMVEGVLPKSFLLENVHGISYSGKEEGFRYLLRATEQINRAAHVKYAVSWKVLDSVEYGVPQKRKRFFLVGHREGGVFRFPPPTHSLPTEPKGIDLLPGIDSLTPCTTAWDAIGGLDPDGEDLEVRGRWAKLLPSIPEGENYLWHTDRKGGLPLFGWRTRFWTFLLKLAKASPSWTLQAQPGPAIGPFHWENRRLSTKELARLQTFPSDVRFVGKRISVQRQLGNAVPSLMAEILAREIASQFFGAKYVEPPMLAVASKGPIPPPEPVAPVPDEFLPLVGTHAPHPGTGRGAAHNRSSAT